VGNTGGRDAMPTDYLMIHAMKHGRPRDDCNKAEQWPDKDRYDQKMVVGESYFVWWFVFYKTITMI
jgi:hypothetical protein